MVINGHSIANRLLRLGEIPLALLVGAIGAVLVFAAGEFGPKVAIAVTLLIPISVVVIIHPRLGVLGMLGLFFSIEEFAGGLGDDAAERSLRTPFYSMAIGPPGIYLPDVLVIGLLGLYVARAIILGRGFPIRIDMYSTALFMIALTMAISAAISYTGPAPFGPMELDLSTMGSVTLYELIARLIGVLQIKFFAMIFPAYLLGLFFFNEEKDIRDVGKVLIIAMMFTIVMAFGRFATNPSLVRGLVPVIYDTATVWLMATVVFYSVGSWASGRFTPRESTVQAIFCALLMILILLSFRRTLWGAIFIATIFFPLVLPRFAWPRFLFLCALAIILGGIVLGGTGPGRAILMSVLARLGETNFDNASTLYRYSLLVYVVDNFWNLPAFGFGITPLWNETVHLRLFKSSMENIHSLFFWVLLRFGYVGFAVFSGALGLVIFGCIKEFRRLRDPAYKLAIGVIVLGIIMYLISGVTNPVFGRIRFLVPLGFSLALLSRLPVIFREPSKSATSNTGP